jgi:hypothetical protein
MANKSKKEYTMFKEYVEDEFPELYADANDVGIDPNVLNSLYGLPAINEAVKALRSLITAKRKEQDKTDHLVTFIEQNADVIHTYFEAKSALTNVVASYNEEHSTLLRIDPDALTENDVIEVGRAAYGSKRTLRRVRNLAAFAQLAKDAGYNINKLRLSPSENEAHVFGSLQDDGTIKAGKETYNTLKDWVISVYTASKERGMRNNIIGNPWKAVSLPDSRGDYVTIDRAYGVVMSAPNDDTPDTS